MEEGRRKRRGTGTPRDVLPVATGCLLGILLSCVPIWICTQRLQGLSVVSDEEDVEEWWADDF